MKAKPSRDPKADFVQTVAELWPVAKGSLAEVRRPCIRPHCPACADGRKHRAFIFLYREEGRARCLYVPARLAPTMRQALANGRKMERRLTELGRELILRARAVRDEG